MKKFIGYILIFFAASFLVDRGYGYICEYLYSHAKGGTTYHYYYSAKGTTEDIILMGSSRMSRHYNPFILEDSLKMSVYNTGVKGNGIILNYGILCEILSRYNPKMIIYDIFSFDMYEDDRFAEDNIRYLDNLKEHFENHEIRDIFMDVCPEEKIKMMSNMYRYNSKLPRLLGDYVHPTENYVKGYNPYHGAMDYSVSIDDGRNDEQSIDSLKLMYFEKFIQKVQSRNILLIVCASPRYGTHSTNSYNNPIKSICKRYEVPFLDNYYNEIISSDPSLFHDSNHLNDKGADVYSSIIIKEIKQIIHED